METEKDCCDCEDFLLCKKVDEKTYKICDKFRDMFPEEAEEEITEELELKDEQTE